MSSLLVQLGTTVGAAAFALVVTEAIYLSLLGFVNVINGTVPIQLASLRRPDPPIFGEKTDIRDAGSAAGA